MGACALLYGISITFSTKKVNDFSLPLLFFVFSVKKASPALCISQKGRHSKSRPPWGTAFAYVYLIFIR